MHHIELDGSTSSPRSSFRGQSTSPARSRAPRRSAPAVDEPPFRPDHLAEYLRASRGWATVCGGKCWASDRFSYAAERLYPGVGYPTVYENAKHALRYLAKARKIDVLLAADFERVNATFSPPEMGTLYVKKGRGEWSCWRPKSTQPAQARKRSAPHFCKPPAVRAVRLSAISTSTGTNVDDKPQFAARQ